MNTLQPMNHDESTTRVLLTLAEVEEIIGISRWTVRRLLNNNELGSVRIGRRRLVHRDQLQTYLDDLLAEDLDHDR